MAGLGNFRKKALLKLQSPDQLDDRVRVVNRWTWLALGGLATVLATVVVWASVSTLPTEVKGAGYVVPKAGWTGVQTTVTGTVKAVVDTGQHVKMNQPLAVIADQTTGKQVRIKANTSGVIAETTVSAGEFVNAGQQLAIMSPSRGDVVVYAYFPVNSARSIAPNSATEVSLDGTPTAAFGFIRGRVRSIGALPATSDRLQQVLLNSTLARQVSRGGPVVEVVIALDTAHTPSGYSWTEGSGPSFRPVSGGEPAHVTIVVDRKHPISYVI